MGAEADLIAALCAALSEAAAVLARGGGKDKLPSGAAGVAAGV